eukprot:7377375-Prymnesium_polylepis.1
MLVKLSNMSCCTNGSRGSFIVLITPKSSSCETQRTARSGPNEPRTRKCGCSSSGASSYASSPDDSLSDHPSGDVRTFASGA